MKCDLERKINNKGKLILHSLWGGVIGYPNI